MNVEGFSVLVLWQQMGFTVTDSIRVWTSLCFLDMWIIPDSDASNDWKIMCVAQKPHTRWCFVFVYGRVWLWTNTRSPTFSPLLPHSVIYYLTILCLFVSVMASSDWLGQDIYSEEEEGSHSSEEEDNSSSSSKEHLSEADRQVIICL